jgi:hypothetical protein
MRIFLLFMLIPNLCFAGIQGFGAKLDPAMVAEQSQLNLKAYLEKVGDKTNDLSADLKWLFQDLFRDINVVIGAKDRGQVSELKRLVGVLDSLFGAVEPTSDMTHEWSVKFLKNFREPVEDEKIQAFMDSLVYERRFAKIMARDAMSDDYYAMLEYLKVWDEWKDSIKAQVDSLDRVGAGFICGSYPIRRK